MGCCHWKRSDLTCLAQVSKTETNKAGVGGGGTDEIPRDEMG